MRIFRTDIHGHVIEARHGDLGRQRVLVDGRIVSDMPFAGLSRPSHFFEVVDDAGETHHVEVRWIDESKFGLGRYRVLVMVDGVERKRLAPVDILRPPTICGHCGYRLEGLPAKNDEVRCPECGRHTPASLVRAASGRGEVDADRPPPPSRTEE
ncbi:MAG: hypothetical protein ACYTGG_11125 [Planctomycetota bacterium]|jgi:hypothetical protein